MALAAVGPAPRSRERERDREEGKTAAPLSPIFAGSQLAPKIPPWPSPGRAAPGLEANQKAAHFSEALGLLVTCTSREPELHRALRAERRRLRRGPPDAGP